MAELRVATADLGLDSVILVDRTTGVPSIAQSGGLAPELLLLSSPLLDWCPLFSSLAGCSASRAPPRGQPRRAKPGYRGFMRGRCVYSVWPKNESGTGTQ